MKKTLLFSLLLSLLLCLPLSAVASEETITVTIANGEICAHETIPLSDLDGNGNLTINDALIGIHEEAYEGEDGYAYYAGPYGTAISTLWGVQNGGAYGYCVNNQSAMSLDDGIRGGDHIYAYVYTDLVTWSDTYAYFSSLGETATLGESITLTLYSSGYDADFNPVTAPVANAVITVDGNPCDIVTDENGSFTFTPAKSGSFRLSAVKDGVTLTPPICTVTVQEATSPETSDFTMAMLSTLSCVCALALCLLTRKKRIH